MKIFCIKANLRIVSYLLLASMIFGTACACMSTIYGEEAKNEKSDYIKWFEFNATYEALYDALEYDMKSADEGVKVDWIEIIACLAAKYGGDFHSYKKSDAKKIADKLSKGEKAEDICKNKKLYNYYYEGYRAALGGIVGHYRIKNDGEKKDVYGIKAFYPLAEGFSCSQFDDFGTSRSYGYKRRHLGHDMMGQVGTPIVAVESGYVEALGWNQYGGWRIGIRSLDGMRYYYYAHLRKDSPYAKGLREGQKVIAGDVIGYMGMTGYSSKENVNNINVPHLHFGMQLIFDESQKDGNGEIWIDAYPIIRLISTHRASVIKKDKEYIRKYEFEDPTAYE